MVGALYQRAIRAGCVIACAALLAGCTAVIHNDPVNQPLTANPAQVDAALTPTVPDNYDDTVVALSFSGGGTRAAAYSFGVLTAFDQTRVPTRSGPVSLLDRLDFLSGVSGGSVLAAYYGLRGRAALADFKQRFLDVDAEQGLQTQLSIGNIARGLQGGVNDATQFPVWLDAHLYNHATFRDLLSRPRPRVWINASDIYNRTAFIFAPVTFSALCSDLSTYPVSLAVAASAAVPVVFAPIVIKNYPGACPVELPAWVQRVRNDPNAAPLIQAYADALERYRSGAIKYVKLLDGGLVDNYGLAGFTIARLASDTPFGPLAPTEAVKLRRFLFLVVDSGRDPSGKWAQTVAGPSGVDLILASSDTATEFWRHWQLLRFRRHHEGLEEQTGGMALRTFGSRSSPLRRAARLELPRRAILYQPPHLQRSGSGSRGGAQCRADPIEIAAGPSQFIDRRRPRRAGRQSGISRFYEFDAARAANPAAAAHGAGRGRTVFTPGARGEGELAAIAPLSIEYQSNLEAKWWWHLYALL